MLNHGLNWSPKENKLEMREGKREERESMFGGDAEDSIEI